MEEIRTYKRKNIRLYTGYECRVSVEATFDPIMKNQRTKQHRIEEMMDRFFNDVKDILSNDNPAESKS